LEKKEKNKMLSLKANVFAGAFCFVSQDAIECVIGFRIDSYTIKRRTLTVIAVILVPLGDLTPCMCIRT
jgi:hypothetical protein